MFNIALVGSSGVGKTHLHCEMAAYPPHIPLPSSGLAPLRVKNKYFDVTVGFNEVTLPLGPAVNGDFDCAMKHTAASFSREILTPKPINGEDQPMASGLIWVVSPRESPEHIPWSAVPSSDLQFRVIVVNCKTHDELNMCDDDWYNACIQNGFEYVRVGNNPALPRPQSTKSGLLSGELEGCERLVQLVFNTMWPKGQRGAGPTNRGLVVGSLTDFSSLLKRLEVVHSFEGNGSLLRVQLSCKYFNSEVVFCAISPEHCITVEDSFLKQQFEEDTTSVIALITNEHLVGEAASSSSMATQIYEQFKDMKQGWSNAEVTVVRDWGSLPTSRSESEAANAERAGIESVSPDVPSEQRLVEVIDITDSDTGDRFCDEMGKVGLSRLIEVIQCAPWPAIQEQTKAGGSSAAKSSLDIGKPSVPTATEAHDRILFIGSHDHCSAAIAGVFNTSDGVISSSGSEYYPPLDLNQPLPYYEHTINNKYYSATVRSVMWTKGTPLVISPKIRKLFHAVVVLLPDAKVDSQWMSLEDTFRLESNAATEGASTPSSESVSLAVFLKNDVEDRFFNKFVETTPIEILVRDEEAAKAADTWWVERVREALEATQWPHAELASDARTKPLASSLAHSNDVEQPSEATTEPVAKSSNDTADAEARPVVYGCELPRNIFVDPLSHISTVCDAVTSRDTSVIQAAVQHVKKHGHRLTSTERERQAAILADCISELLDDEEEPADVPSSAAAADEDIPSKKNDE